MAPCPLCPCSQSEVWEPIGPADGATTITVQLKVDPSVANELHRVLLDVSTPGSPHYGELTATTASQIHVYLPEATRVYWVTRALDSKYSKADVNVGCISRIFNCVLLY